VNATATRGNLLVRRSPATFFKLIDTCSRKYRMRMCINKTRQEHPTTSINNGRVVINERFDLSSNSLDQTIANEQSPTRNNPELTHLRANPRPRRPSQRHHLRTVNYSE